jgi:hypothetical protein
VASLGTLGGIVGGPIFMALDIIVALFWGAVSGEWKGASHRDFAYCWIGIGILLVSIAVTSAANRCSASGLAAMAGPYFLFVR